MQHEKGLIFRAISSISLVEAISKFNFPGKLLTIFSISRSLICRLSSRKCAVIESAPEFKAIFAALIISGKLSPLAFLKVAI